MEQKRFNVVSLFCGAGGLDMGFHNEGFRVVWANDFNEDACATYDLWANYNPDGTKKEESERTIIEVGDVTKIDFNSICPDVEIDVVLGGFPCQGFSLAGPRQVDDSRNVMYLHFVEMVKVKNPRVFIAENVYGIYTLDDGVIYDKIINDFEELGYAVSVQLVNAKDYSVPQDRQRVVFLGIRKDLCPSDDCRFKFRLKPTEPVNLRKGLEGLEPPTPDEICDAPFSSRFMSRNRHRKYDEVSFTIPAMAKQVPLSPDSAGMEYVDTDLFQFVGGEENNRRLSYKEAAAIQTFPRDMEFVGDLTSKYKQIGNAVPVKLAESIAKVVRYVLENPKKDEDFEFVDIDNEIDLSIKKSQNDTGRAFEYAIATETFKVLKDAGWSPEQLELVRDSEYFLTESSFNKVCEFSDEEERFLQNGIKEDYCNSAKSAMQEIVKGEPILCNVSDLYIKIKVLASSSGKTGDVRDVVIVICDNKNRDKVIQEIGISCKNNHEAVKHPRITKDFDFVSQYTNDLYKCSNEFIECLKRVAAVVDDLAGKHRVWNNVPAELKNKVYCDIVEAYIEEIHSQAVSITDNEKKEKFASSFFEYMFGQYDFYKVIKIDKKKTVKLQPYNIHGNLRKAYHGEKSNQSSSKANVPKEIVLVRKKPNSKTTLEIHFENWIISMRIHNADGPIKMTSLKWDVQIIAQPHTISIGEINWK